MKREKIIEAIVKDLLTGCEDTVCIDLLEEYLTSGFVGFENISDQELAECYSNPVHEFDRKKIKGANIINSELQDQDSF